jgi:hypothetical protein
MFACGKFAAECVSKHNTIPGNQGTHLRRHFAWLTGAPARQSDCPEHEFAIGRFG